MDPVLLGNHHNPEGAHLTWAPRAVAARARSFPEKMALGTGPVPGRGSGKRCLRLSQGMLAPVGDFGRLSLGDSRTCLWEPHALTPELSQGVGPGPGGLYSPSEDTSCRGNSGCTSCVSCQDSGELWVCLVVPKEALLCGSTWGLPPTP